MMRIGTKLIRNELEILKQRMKQDRNLIQIIYGPRQTGKTTLIAQFLRRTDLPSHLATAEAISTQPDAWISRQWETSRLLLAANKSSGAILIIDEIQKIPNWSEQVKKERDADSRMNLPLKVIIVCSSGSFDKQDLHNILPDRFEAIYVGHWTFVEMNAAFGYSPEQYVWFGGYPGAAPFIQDEIQWKSYVHSSLIETSISMDILMLTRVDKPGLMRRFFELGCQSSGQILSYTKIMNRLQDAGNTTTLAHYLHLLDGAGLLAGLEKFSRGTIRKRASSPKFQVQNTALLTATQPESFSTIYANPSRWGRWVESCVGAHLINACLKNQLTLHYWRHVNDELDFVLSDGNKIIGIEVTTAFKHRKSGITAFSKTYHPDKMLTIGQDGLSWQEFIKLDPKSLLL